MSSGFSGIKMTSAPTQMPTCSAKEASFATHNFHDEYAFVANGGVTDFVDGAHCGVNCGVKPDGFVRAVHVVVDGCRDAYDLHAAYSC